jgi:hypothetical protein
MVEMRQQGGLAAVKVIKQVILHENPRPDTIVLDLDSL